MAISFTPTGISAKLLFLYDTTPLISFSDGSPFGLSAIMFVPMMQFFTSSTQIDSR